jgi:integrase/recombinase XerD
MQSLLGHAHVDTTARYIHLAPAHVKEEFDAARARLRSQPASRPQE